MMRNLIDLIESADKGLFGPIFHRTSSLSDFADFDLSKASPSAVLGPAIYATFGGSKWNTPGSNILSGYVKGRIIDLTKPLEAEDIERISGLIGKPIDVIPFITLERRYGSVAAGLKSAGYVAAIHEGPGSTGKHIAVFDPAFIVRRRFDIVNEIKKEISGEEMLREYNRQHHHSIDSPEMERYIISNQWMLSSLEPGQIKSEEELLDLDDPFGRVLDFDEDRITQAMSEINQLSPVIVGPDGSIIDGNHRAQAAKRLGVSISAYRPVKTLHEDQNELSSEIEDFLNDLTPDDVGHQFFDDVILYFEGFNEECWDDYYERCDLSPGDPRYLSGEDDLIREILSGWTAELKQNGVNAAMTFHGWWNNEIYYAIFAKH